MLPFIFTALGVSVGTIGGVWAVSIFQGMAGHDAVAIYAALVAGAPGFAAFLSGLLLIAVGSVLHHLARIERNTGDTAAAMVELLNRNPR